MKTYFFICFFLFAITLASNAQVIDAAPSGVKNIRAVEGGGEQVAIDTKTPLLTLIQRLEKPWKFVQTGKAYWIGYTNNMYSIANYKDRAIPLLVNFIDTAKSFRARLGGLYTLHLIGINSKIVGRFVEDFSDKKARKAILRYLNDKSLNTEVVSLLMRDPWLSDIPLFIEYLSESGRDYSMVLGALNRYDFNNKPMGQKIDRDILRKEIPILYTDTNPSRPSNPVYSFISYEKAFGSSFTIDDEITQSVEWLRGKKELKTNKTYSAEQEFGFSFSFLMGIVFDYVAFQSSYFYTFTNHKFKLYGPIKARRIWLDWWSKLHENEKNKFYSFVHLPIEERFKKN